VGQTGEINAYRNFVGNLLKVGQRERQRRSREDNIKIGFMQIRCENENWIEIVSGISAFN
jgi:hypothetical protein